MTEIPQPYPGIRPFEQEDWPIFFGRETQANQLLHKLETNRFAAVVGSSGSGKSSLVKAGLIPLICQGFLRNVTDWSTLVCRPGLDPFSGLAEQISQLNRIGESEERSDDAVSVTSSLIGAELRTSRDGIISLLRSLKLPETRHFLVVVDQFEEIFSFRASLVSASSASRGEAERFVDCLLQSCAAPVSSPLEAEGASLSQRVWVILTMRSDFIGHCEIFPALAQAVSDSQFLVPVLDSEQKKEAITRPGHAGEVDGATYEPFDFHDGVVSIIVNETGDRLDQLPLMQHALMRTWKLAKARVAKATTALRLTLEDYQGAGRIEQALHNDAEAAWTQIKKDARLTLIGRQMFMLLCDISESGKLTRRRPKVSAVIQATGAKVKELENIIKIFQQDDRNFLLPSLVSSKKSGLDLEDALDISHEALLRQWRTYREWQDEERRNVDELIDLKKKASLYFKNDPRMTEDPLPEKALARAMAWRETLTEAWAMRYVSHEEWDAIDAFIEVSQKVILENQGQALISARRAAERERRLKLLATYVIVTGILVAAAAMVWAAKSIREADMRKLAAMAAEKEAKIAVLKAEKEQTQRFLISIGSSDVEMEGFNPDERSALWDAAELLPSSEEVRTKLIENWLGDIDSSRKAFQNDGVALKAVIGTSEARRRHASEKVMALVNKIFDEKGHVPTNEFWLGTSKVLDAEQRLTVVRRLSEAIENGQQVTIDRLAALGEALAAITRGAISEEGAVLAARGAHALAMKFEDPAIDQAERWRTLGPVLAALIPRLDANDCSYLAHTLIKLLENPQNISNKDTLEDMLVVLADCLDGGNVVALAERIVSVIASQEAIAWNPKGVLEALVKHIDEPKATALAGRLIEKVENPQTKVDRLAIVGGALAVLLDRMDRHNGATVAARAAQVLCKAMDESEAKSNILLAVGLSLVDVLPQTDIKDRASFAARAVRVIGKSRTKLLTESTPSSPILSMQMEYLLEALVGHLGETDAGAFAEDLTKVLEESQGMDPKRRPNLSRALVALSSRLDTKTTELVADRMAKALEDLRVTDPDDLLVLKEAFSVLAPRLDEKDAAKLAERMARELEKPLKTDANRLATLGEVLAVLARRAEGDVPLTLRIRGTQIVVQVLQNPKDIPSEFLTHLGYALCALSSNIPEARNTWRLGLSYAFLGQVPKKPKKEREANEERDAIVKISVLLSAQDNSDVLKWPFCVGEAEQVMLTALEKQTGAVFGGDVWKFVKQANQLGLADLDGPTRRPQAEDAVGEFQQVRRPVSEPK